MKTRTKVLVVLIIAVVVILAMPIVNVVMARPAPSLAGYHTGDPELDAVAHVLAGKCASCHTGEGQVPWYGKLPVAGGLVRADIETGLRYMNYAQELAPTGDGPVGEVVLAKTEHVLDSEAMPPMRYLAMHWNAALSREDREAVAKWVKKVRATHYAGDGVAPGFADEPVQPLPQTMPADAAKAALGEKLFHDVRLSHDDSISCASCHDLAKGGTDQVQFSTGVGGAKGGINSPTVYNSVFHVKQFWDGRAADLVEQADGPVNNPIEMASNWGETAKKLEQDAEFAAAFMAVYPGGFTKEACTDAIGEFERTLVTPDSRFDLYLKGRQDALTADEKAGYELFKELGCVMCHVGKAMGGQSFEQMGRTHPYFEERGGLTEADNGRYNVTKAQEDVHKFRTPTLRNIALTYPYFHDGTTADLGKAVDVMARVMLDMGLSVTERERLVAFLHTLTGQYNGVSLAEMRTD